MRFVSSQWAFQAFSFRARQVGRRLSKRISCAAASSASGGRGGSGDNHACHHARASGAGVGPGGAGAASGPKAIRFELYSSGAKGSAFFSRAESGSRQPKTAVRPFM